MSTLSSHAGYHVGQRVYLLESTMGGSDHGDEITYPRGTPALIDRIENIGGSQGIGFHVVIGEIVNVFDEGDGPYSQFLSTEPVADDYIDILIKDIAQRSAVCLDSPPDWFAMEYGGPLRLIHQVEGNLSDNGQMRSDAVLLELRDFATKQSKAMDDPRGDNSGEESRPPNGDDYNDLYNAVFKRDTGSPA